MIRIKNIVAQGGYSYSKYLKKQLAEVVANSLDHKEYNAGDIKNASHDYNSADISLEDNLEVSLDSFKKYTRVTGKLFDTFGLTDTNYLTEDKLNTIAKLELGEDERTSEFVKPVKRNYKSVMGADGYPIEVTKEDIKRKYYIDDVGAKIHFKPEDVKVKSGFKKKTAIELVFSMDQSFSHASALMNAEDKERVAALWLECAEKSYKESFSHYLKTYHGMEGETAAYLFFHNDNRTNNPHDHVHLNIPSLIRLEDGTIKAIEMNAMRQKNFHNSMDYMFRTEFVKRWNEEFGKQYPTEAYDEDKISLTEQRANFESKEINNWRVAFKDEILNKIYNRSKSKELIDNVIKQQVRDEAQRTELSRMKIQNQIDTIDKNLKDFELPTNYGIVLGYGKAPYLDNKKNNMSYFVELELKNGKTKKIWSTDLEQAIKKSNIKIGDFSGFSETGSREWEHTNQKGEVEKRVKRTWEATKLEKYQDEINLLADLDSQMKMIDRAFESRVKVIESSKNRDAVWLAIKDEKKILGKELKDAEMHKSALELGDELKDKDSRGMNTLSKDDEQLLEKLTDINPFFTKFDLIMELSKTELLGSKAEKLAEDKIEEWNKNGLLFSKQKDPDYPVSYVTKKLALQELQNIKSASNLVKNTSSSGIQEYKEAIFEVLRNQPKKFRFNKLQVDLMKAVLEPNGSRLVICEGFPGTGKSTVMGKAIELAKQYKGTKSIVLAPTGKVAQSAANDTTADSTNTIDGWLLSIEQGKAKIDNNSIIFIDEAGMVGTKNYNRFFKHINKAVEDGIDVRVVLIGDTNQIQSVQAGNTYTNIVKQSQDKVKYLRKIIRQKDEVSLEIANITSLAKVDVEDMATIKKEGKHVEKSWDVLADNNRIFEFDTTTDKNKWIVEKYLSDKNEFKEKIILCSSNDEIKKLNEQIQDERIIRGELKGNFVENNQERFYVGDRIMVNKNQKEYKNGDFGVITKISKDGKIEVDFGEGAEGKIKTINDPAKIKLAYSISVHKSQGLTVNQTYLNGTVSAVNDQDIWNVAQTRARYETLVAVVKSEKIQVKESFKTENKKENLLDVALSIEAEKSKPSEVEVHKAKNINNALEMTNETIIAKSSINESVLKKLNFNFTKFKSIAKSVFQFKKPPVEIINQRNEKGLQNGLTVMHGAEYPKQNTQVIKPNQTIKKKKEIKQSL